MFGGAFTKAWWGHQGTVYLSFGDWREFDSFALPKIGYV